MRWKVRFYIKMKCLFETSDKNGKAQHLGSSMSLPAHSLTFILDRMYVEPPCDLLLIPILSSGGATGLWGRPSTVLDGSSACVRVSEIECLVRQSGGVSAGLASESITKTDGGKMETGGRERKSQSHL